MTENEMNKLNGFTLSLRKWPKFFYRLERGGGGSVREILCCMFHQVVQFQIMPTDPTASLNTLFLAAPDYQPNLHGNSHREGYEPVGDDDGEGEREARVTQEGVCGNNYM